jgi:DNA primase
VIPDEEIERVRESVDIIAIVSEFVTLKRMGSSFRGPCPFHQGTHRNFSVDPKRRRYHCFVCGEGGDAFTFLQKRLGIDWPTSVRMAAEKSGIELREVATRREGPDPREPLWEVNASAQDYFHRMLWEDPAGGVARDYLAEREVARDVADRFGLGFAPRDASALRSHLATLGFEDQRQVDAGLLTRREDGGELRPRFRGRLIFPIYDVSGRVVGFGGRLVGPGEPKYLNSADSPAFAKGKLLYGLNWARHAIRRADRVLLVEGYFDLVRLASAGIEEVVAPLGTALTSDQAELITRHSKNVFLLYDGDRAGLKATFRAGDELLKHGSTVRVVSLPDGEDPDSYVRRNGREAMERQIGQSIDVFERKIQLLQRGGWFADLHRRRRAIDHLLPTIRSASDQVTRDLYIGRAAEAAGVERGVLSGEAGREAGARTARTVRQPPAAESRRRVPPPTRSGKAMRGHGRPIAGLSAERELVRVMLTLRSTIERIVERIGPGQFRHPHYREIFEVLARAGAEASTEEVAALISEDATPVLDKLLAEPDAVQDVDRMIQDCVTHLEVRALRERNAEIQRLMTAATADEKDVLVAQKQANSDEIRRLTESRMVS